MAGIGVSGAGDVNGDGLADLLVGASGVGTGDTGEAYLVFGKADAVTVLVDDLGAGGFQILKDTNFDFVGESVSGAGDANGDGLADLIVSAVGAEPGDAAYVVLGKSDGMDVDLASLADSGFDMRTNGFGGDLVRRFVVEIFSSGFEAL